MYASSKVIIEQQLSHFREMGERLVANMLIKGYLKEDFHYTPYSTLSYLIIGDREVQNPVMMAIPPKELP